MTFLETIRNRRRPPAAAAESQEAESQELTDRFARLNEREAVAGLNQFDQAELEAIETFERSHRERSGVLNKLRYLRQREPVTGYDALETDAIEEALTGSDTNTIKAAREYENKLKKRPTALKGIDRALRASRGASATSSRSPTFDASQPQVVGNGLPAKARQDPEPEHDHESL
jgi:hypothetical protein